MLEAEDFIQGAASVPGTVGRFGHFGRDGKLGVVAGQEVLQHGVGLVDGLGASQAQFGYQTILEGSGGAFHTTFSLWRAGEDLPDAQFGNGLAEGGGLHRWLDMPGPAGKLEHAVAVAVDGNRPAKACDQSLHQGEIAAGVLLGAEHGVDHGAGGVVHGQQQGELGTVIAQPPVMACRPPAPASRPGACAVVVPGAWADAAGGDW